MTEEIVTQCKADGCNEPRHCQSLCRIHYRRKWYADRQLRTDRPTCEIDGCEKQIFSRQWCSAHYALWQRNGNPHLWKVRLQGKTNADKLWQHVNLTADDTRCWEWTRGTSKGYGTIEVDGEKWKTHQYAWFLTHGYKSQLLIRHTCDNRLCCNPKHLLEGTNQDNMTDLVMRGWPGRRQPFPENEYREILALLGTMSMSKIAQKMNKGRSIIQDIKNGTHWTCKIYDGNTC